MKKLFLSLAALMMTMSAPVMTSCSSEDLDEVAPVEEVKENVVTLTIKMPEQAETRVGINEETLKLTGWEEKDVVKVYHFAYPDLSEGITFKCTDPSEGTFSGTLPAGKTLDDYNFAVYGRDAVFNTSISENYVVFAANEVHDNLKDCICLAGPIKNGSCTMSVYNNVIKVTNEGGPITGAWKQERQGIIKPYGTINDRSGFIPGHISKQSAFDEAKITIPSGVSYIFMPEMQGTIGFFTENGTAIIPEKTISTAVVGKLYKITIVAPYTGRAKATIDGSEVDVKWIQLWEDGPKFAEHNVGASSYTDKGIKMTFTDAVKEGDEYVWGANWCTPSRDDLDHLMTAAKGQTDDKVKCEFTKEGSTYAFKFTGKEDGYTWNSVFFPAQYGIVDYGYAFYWSGTADDRASWYMKLFYNNALLSDWLPQNDYSEFYVRPVLKN